MPTETIRFPGPAGELAARLDAPAGAPRACAIFAHCFTCSKDSKAAAYVGKALAEHGIATLRLDFSGLEFTSNVEDLVAAAAWLRDNRAAPRVLVGHSLGGAAVLAAAGKIAEARAVATIGAPFDPGHVTHVVEKSSMTVSQRFLDDLKQQNPAQTIGSLRKPLLIFHSPQDTIVEIENAAKIFLAAKHPKSFVSLDGADHLLTDRRDAQYAASVLAAWASRYLD